VNRSLVCPAYYDWAGGARVPVGDWLSSLNISPLQTRVIRIGSHPPSGHRATQGAARPGRLGAGLMGAPLYSRVERCKQETLHANWNSPAGRSASYFAYSTRRLIGASFVLCPQKTQTALITACRSPPGLNVAENDCHTAAKPTSICGAVQRSCAQPTAATAP
jgi:hypothetical protein